MALVDLTWETPNRTPNRNFRPWCVLPALMMPDTCFPGVRRHVGKHYVKALGSAAIIQVSKTDCGFEADKLAPVQVEHGVVLIFAQRVKVHDNGVASGSRDTSTMAATSPESIHLRLYSALHEGALNSGYRIAHGDWPSRDRNPSCVSATRHESFGCFVPKQES